MTEPSAKLHIKEHKESANEREMADLVGTFFSCWIAGSPESTVVIIVFPPQNKSGMALMKNLIRVDAWKHGFGNFDDSFGVGHVIASKKVALIKHLVAFGDHAN